MPVRQLPPGKYVLRAILSSGGRARQDADARLRGRAADGADDVGRGARHRRRSTRDLFLPVDDDTMSPARSRATRRSTRRRWRRSASGVAPAVKAAFDQGVASLAAGDFTKAEASFKNAIEPDADSTRAAGAIWRPSFAAAGHDHEAAGAWQTALIDGSDLPQIYEWLGDALLRTHDFARRARFSRKRRRSGRPTPRFTKPLALLYATFGQGREAVRTLERYLADRQDDRDAYFYGGRVDLSPARRRRGRRTAAPTIGSSPTRTRTRYLRSTRAAGGPRQAVGGFPGSEK